jgi:LAO/AO transport system kinase
MSAAAAAETPEALCDAVRRGDRRALARTITLLESTRADLAARGQAVLEGVVGSTGGATRIGITGPPGVGKSSFIETLGLFLIEHGHRVAVLAVDPSSPVTGGSILGDKTRMEELSRSPSAFIRPTPSGGSLGGVAHRTRECMMVCEAAGYDVILVETVGIGQSEVAVASMVDFFLVLLSPSGGDDLQGIKKGVMELADALVVNKADGDLAHAAERTRGSYAAAVELIRPSSNVWSPRVMTASALKREGIARIWETIREHQALTQESGEREERRRNQARAWMWSLVERELERSFRTSPAVTALLGDLEQEVQARKTTPAAAARALLAAFTGR